MMNANAEASFSGTDFNESESLDERDYDHDESMLSVQQPCASHSNHLKLSVGFADSDDSGGDNEGMANTTMMEWFGARNRNQEFHNDFDMELSADRVRSLIQGEQLMFENLHDGQFAEEVFVPKQPKIKHGYLFGDCIGEGSYAKVKEVVEDETLVRRAVKIIKQNRLRKIPNGADNVQREIRILRKISHKNVIRMIETFRCEEKQKLYMVMEFCMGSVQQIMDSSPGKYLPEPDAHNFFGQLMSGIEYIHSIGIIHKDIKPGNLLLGSDLTLKISDFGVAEVLSPYQADDSCSIVQGTPKFQAPELVSGNSDTFSGFKADVWCCGVTLYNMVSGLYPFDGEAIMKLYDNIANLPLKMPDNVTLDMFLKELLCGMLTKNADERWSVDVVRSSPWCRKGFEMPSVWSLGVEHMPSVYRPLTVNTALEMMYADSPPPGVMMEDYEYEGDYTMATADQTAVTGINDSQAPEPARPPRPARRHRTFLSCLNPSDSP